MISMPGSSDRMVERIWRTDAESSTIRTRTGWLSIALSLPLNPEDGRLDLLQAGHYAVHHRFRMPHHQIAPRPQMRAKLLHDLALRFLLEIDQDVAAEDDVDVAIHRIARIHQVHAHEIGAAAQLGHHPHLVRGTVAREQEIALDEFGRHRSQHVAAVDRRPGEP